MVLLRLVPMAFCVAMNQCWFIFAHLGFVWLAYGA